MQVKSCFAAVKNRPVIRMLFKVFLAVCVLIVLYFLFITSSYNIKHIRNTVAEVLGVEAAELRFVEGGRRCDTMIMFEYLGDKKHLAKLRPEILDALKKTPDKLPPKEQELLKEEQEVLQLQKNKWLQPIRSFISSHAIPVSFEDDVEVFACGSEKFRLPGYVLIVFNGHRMFVFYFT